MRTSWEELRDASSVEAMFGESNGGSQPCTPSTHDNRIVLVIHHVVGGGPTTLHTQRPKRRRLEKKIYMDESEIDNGEIVREN